MSLLKTECDSSAFLGVCDSHEMKTGMPTDEKHSKKQPKRRQSRLIHGRAHVGQSSKDTELHDSEDEYEALHDWNVTNDPQYLKEAYDIGAKKGEFSKEEIDQLVINITQFCSHHSIEDPADIVISHRSQSNLKYSKQLKSAFYQYACRHIPRTIFSVYRCLQRILDESNYKGKFTEDEKVLLDKLLALYGRQWKKIGNMMDRSAQSLIDHKRSVGSHKGSWSEEEEESLIMAMKWVAEQQGVSLHQLADVGLPWTAVSQKIPGRTPVQCRHKWFVNLKCIFSPVERWSPLDDVKLIENMYDCGVTHIADIPWSDFISGWPAAGSVNNVRKNWWRLKQMVPNANAKTLEEIISFLYECIKPALSSP